MDTLYNAGVGMWILFIFSAFLIGMVAWNFLKFIIFALGPSEKKKKSTKGK